MSKQPKDTGAPVDDYDANMKWEARRISDLEKSRSLLGKAVIALAAAVVLVSAGVFSILPLKESVPYVIRVDQTTGNTDIVTRVDEQAMEWDEVMTTHWVARYVRAREGYDWYTLQADYDFVGLLSSPDVGKVYAGQFMGNNPIQERNANRVRTTVEIISVVPSQAYTATVRFRTRTGAPDSPATATTRTAVATIAFRYRPASRIEMRSRMENPAGFEVTSYRVDAEMGGAP